MDILKLIGQEAEIVSTCIKEDAEVWEQVKSQRDNPDNNKVTVIALCGESAAGKTTLLRALKETDENISVISADNYYKDISDLISRYGSFTRLVEDGYDAESAAAFNMEHLARDIEALKKGQEIWLPFYDMTTGQSVPDARLLKPKSVVIIEGICTFYEPIRDLFDVRIFLQADKERQKRRYFERAAERGQNPKEIQKQFELVCLAAQKNIIPNQKYADLIVKLKPAQSDLKERKAQAVKSCSDMQPPSLVSPVRTTGITKSEPSESDAKPHFTSIYDPKFWAYHLGRSREKQ